jgi:hypothetical protein
MIQVDMTSYPDFRVCLRILATKKRVDKKLFFAMRIIYGKALRTTKNLGPLEMQLQVVQ